MTTAETHKYEKYVQLLEANKNLILTGAPGTGKTFMAKEIAKHLILHFFYKYKKYSQEFQNFREKDYDKLWKEHIKMVQFHPSIDYSDFVEGLRPVMNTQGELIFERINGIFKTFCEQSLYKYAIRKKSDSQLQFTGKLSDSLYKEVYDAAIQEILANGCLHSYTHNQYIHEFSVSDDKHNIIFNYNEIKWFDDWSISKKLYNSLNLSYKTLIGKRPTPMYDEIKRVLLQFRKEELMGIETTNCTQAVVYEQWKIFDSDENLNVVIYFYFFLFEWINIFLGKYYEGVLLPNVFIIDEINRGEISKIFGELFLSIDPGYRGENGLVQTQYQNMIESGDIFEKGFYVPENVYIIGTMNDIDRSVESMDFAMRRRFAFAEVTAEESFQNMILDNEDFTEDEKNEIKKRMSSLNDAICKPDFRLGEAYQIGAAYFFKYLKYKGYGMDSAFDMLWKNHLKGLLHEYLRGNQNAESQLESFERAYDIRK